MKFWDFIDRIEGGLASVGAGLCLFAMMIVTVISVIGRYVLHTDILPGAYNIIERVLFPLIIFWAVPLAHRQGMFPRFETFYESLPAGLRRVVAIVVLGVEVAVYAIVMYYVVRFVLSSIEADRTMQIGTDFWPMWPILVMIPLAFGLMLLEMLRLLWIDVRGIGKPTLHGEQAGAPVWTD
ncbi:MAG TPA: TRAP transporter small permease [Burkholderiaceae bacterium]|nr:TRAP transporter small permease [Burkholderiaceae bacterium]